MMHLLSRRISLLLVGALTVLGQRAFGATTVGVTDPNLICSPYNWYRSESYIQSPNPGAYLKLGFTGTGISIDFDSAPLVDAAVPAAQFPIVRYSVDGGQATTLQLTSKTGLVQCAKGLSSGNHTLLLQYVAGYVFLDFWSPINVVRVKDFVVDEGATTVQPSGPIAKLSKNALFLGDSITDGDNTVTTFAGGVTNATETQDATVGYAPVVAAGIGAEHGIVAYGGASWDGHAADGHTPGLMTFYSMLDRVHSRLVKGKFSPIPDDIFVNMGENQGPGGNDVEKMLQELRSASNPSTNIFVIVPFSGRARTPLTSGLAGYSAKSPADMHVHLIDLGDNPYLTDSGPTMFAVDGQHPLAALDAMLGAQIVEARAKILYGKR